jgi:hypothetical protein
MLATRVRVRKKRLTGTRGFTTWVVRQAWVVWVVWVGGWFFT